MEKLVYLLSRPSDDSGADLRRDLIEKAAPALRQAGAGRIHLSVDDENVAAGKGVLIRRSDPPIRAMLSFWLENVGDRHAGEAALRQHAPCVAGYHVEESRPLLHEPPVGQRAPGFSLVTCIAQKPDISRDEFTERWFEEHRKVAIEIQSTFGYVRNLVREKLTDEGGAWDGIVEESFPVGALSDPLVWYDCDSKEEYQRRLKRMMASVTAFLDLSVLESTPMSEYFLG